ncbi:MAG: adenylate/guanylate cyclase domain-containing protein [Gammaproteobacteria bacterium]
MADSVKKWLDDNGLGKYGEIFTCNEIDLSILPLLTEEDLKELGLSLGARRRLQAAIGQLPQTGPPSIQSSATDRASSSITESSPNTNHVASSEPVLAAWERQPDARKPATVLFADITGSTALTEHLDAEDTHDLLDGVRQRMCTAIKHNRGTLCRVMGDGVMAVFGAPLASESHAIEACEAAQQMQQAISNYTHELREQHGSGLKIRIGLHSGEIVVLVGGEGDQVEYDADGPTVPIAARMEQIAQPGEVYLTAATHSLAENRIEAEALEPVSVKGISAPIKVFALRRVKSAEEAAEEVRHKPFVGRRAEINQFDGMLETCLREGQGRTIYVRGEPGIGKTRLVEEFSRNAQQFGLSVHRGLVLPFGVGKGQDAIRSIVRSLLAVASDSSTAERQQAVREALADGRLEPIQTVFINDLLDLQQPTEQRALYDAMDNATRNQGKQITVSSLLVNSCGNQSILLIVEDVHWADTLTLAHLAALTRTVADTAALLTMTSRIEGDQLGQSWRATTEGSPLTTIDLGPLRPQDSIALISEYVDATDALAKVCLKRAAGNPLFLEQLLRTAQEGSAETLPESIQSLVLARLDRLEPQDKQALQAAAVIGQRFDTATLYHLLDTANYDVGVLIEHSLVKPEGSGYLFAHALIQESVYASLVKGRRQTLHRLAAAWFADSDPVLHAEHLDRGADKGAPLAYLKAAQSQSTQYRTEQALRLAERGLEIAATNLDRFELNCLCAELLHDLGRVADSIATFRHGLDIADNDTQRCRARLGLAAGMRIMDELDEALDMLQQAESEANQHNLETELARIHHLRGNLYFPMGKVDQCVQEHRRALDYARKIGSPELEAMALGGIGDGLYAQGRLLSSFKVTSECLEVSRQHGLGRIEVANEPMQLGAYQYLNDLHSAFDGAL